MHNKSHHLCRVRQDCLIHQGQEGEIHIQEPRPESSYSPEAILPIGKARTTINAEEEEQ
jgi:hypothetical protein